MSERQEILELLAKGKINADEAAELLEIFQWDDRVDIENIKNDQEIMDRIKEEVADVITYILSLANQLSIDLSETVLTKLEQNRRKYDKDVVLRTGAYRKDKL